MSELARICFSISVFWDRGVKIKVKGLTVSNEDCHLLSVWCGAHGIYCCLTKFQSFDFVGHDSLLHYVLQEFLCAFSIGKFCVGFEG